MITRIEIDGFKSLRDFSMDLEPFTVLVGPNSAGKSNVLEALMLLSRLASMPIAEAFKGGRGRALDQFTRQGGEPGRTMRFAVEMLVFPGSHYGARGEDRQTRLRYELSLERRVLASGAERISVKDEQLRAIERSHDLWIDAHPRFQAHADYGFDGLPILRQLGHTSRARRITQDPISAAPTEAHVPETHTAIGWLCGADGAQRKYSFSSADEQEGTEPSRVKSPGPGDAGEARPTTAGASAEGSGPAAFADLPVIETLFADLELARARLIHLDPSRLRTPSERIVEGALAPDASNLPTVLAALAPSTLGEIRSDLVSLVPGISSVNVVPEGESFQIHFEFSGGESLPARLASDGTLRLLALLTVLRVEPRSFLGIEEPENGVYPGRLRTLLTFLEELTEHVASPKPQSDDEPSGRIPSRTLHTQILVTTHSPVVLATLRSKPQCLRFLNVVRRDGRLVTHARKVAPSVTPTQAREFVSLREIDRLLDSAHAEVAEAGE